MHTAQDPEDNFTSKTQTKKFEKDQPDSPEIFADDWKKSPPNIPQK